jgi:glucans biosynthesis protein
MPTTNEYADNVVVYWAPAVPPEAGEKRELTYRLRWTRQEPGGSKRGGRVLATYLKPLYGHQDLFRYLIDFSWEGENRGPFAANRVPAIGLEVSRDGELLERFVEANPYTRAWRLNFVVRYKEPRMQVPLRAWLSDGKEGGWRTEAWNYTMVPQGELSEALVSRQSSIDG